MLNNEMLLKNIKYLCDKHNIKITNLEKELGFGAGIITRWGNNADPSLSKIIDIANYFRISLDEVVGYNQNKNDEFLSVLIKITEEQIATWHKAENNDSVVQFCGLKIFREKEFTELQYHSQYNNGYFIIYCFCSREDLLNPLELCLYIQPQNASAVLQKYTVDSLRPLWIKILKNLGDNAPDEIKAEDVKNSLILQYGGNEIQKLQKKMNMTFASNIYDEKIKEIMLFKGCLLYDMNVDCVMDTEAISGVTHIAKDFYYKHKDKLGNVIKAKLSKGQDLVLIYENYLMKLSGFSWGKECGMTGYNGLIEVLKDAGFDISDHTVFNKNNLVLTPIR